MSAVLLCWIIIHVFSARSADAHPLSISLFCSRLAENSFPGFIFIFGASVVLFLTRHVAVDQLRPDRPAAVHVDVEVSRRAAGVLVRLAGALVRSWEGK